MTYDEIVINIKNGTIKKGDFILLKRRFDEKYKNLTEQKYRELIIQVDIESKYAVKVNPYQIMISPSHLRHLPPSNICQQYYQNLKNQNYSQEDNYQ